MSSANVKLKMRTATVKPRRRWLPWPSEAEHQRELDAMSKLVQESLEQASRHIHDNQIIRFENDRLKGEIRLLKKTIKQLREDEVQL